MNNERLEARIVERGKEFFAAISGEAPGVFNKGWWTGKVMDWAMKNEDFKVQLFRFVDVLPYLNTSEALIRHIQEYFGDKESEIPSVLKWGAGKAGIGGKLGATFMGKTIRSNLENMARQFIIGQNAKEAVKGLNKLRKQGFAFTVDILGEATVSQAEATAYKDSYLELLDALAKEQNKWKPLAPAFADSKLDWSCQPRINVSVKPSAFYSQAKPVAQEDSIQGIMASVAAIYRKVMEMEGLLCIDMEQLRYKEMTIELYKRLRTSSAFRDYPHLCLVLQSYLKDTDKDLDELIAWARKEELPIAVRLVKGAYWDYETVQAVQNGWPVPVWTNKAESDMAFERQSRKILENHDLVYFACGSHNVRSISMVMEHARELGVPEDRYEFQVLYGMAEPVRKGLLNVAGRVRLYCPYGDLIPGMAYLVRRLLENTANESFLRQSFAEGEELERLLENPEETLKRDKAHHAQDRPKREEEDRFVNHSMVDFTIPSVREAFTHAIADVRKQQGKTYPLFIDAKEVNTEDRIPSANPADFEEVLGEVCQAGTAEVDQAVAAAQKAYTAWRDVSPEDRAGYLFKAAELARKRIYELSAWQILEAGKQWDQAYHDVGEGIDFMEYYAWEMIRLGEPRRMGRAPGELNHMFYQGKGVAAVIAPWNFPFAISAGMSTAAIVAGNCVVYKPSGLSSIIGWGLMQLLRDAGLPPGVFNYCPGRGSVMGDHLVEHPDVALIAFTGSVEVGLRIQEKAAKPQPGQLHCKRVVAEMGGKNAIIIDDDADLDEAVLQVLYSAFGFQGQKCSACSRVIVLEAIYERFIERLAEAAKSVRLGPAENPENYMGPVIDPGAKKNILKYIDIAEEEGAILVKRDAPDKDKGCYVPLTIVTDIEPHHRIAREEIFGPVLAVMKAKTFAQAIDMANDSDYALTGGVFSRSPQHLDMARRLFRVGNLYLNRNNTGALVERQPFGGFKLSGVGSKAGGPDYLLQLMDPRVITENTMRRGFAPLEDDDEWIA